MSYKTFTTRFGTVAMEALEKLRIEFPGCKFAAGVHKDARGIYAFSSDTKEYGEKIELESGDFFWNPTQANLDKIKATLSDYKTLQLDRIPVKLKCGVTIEVYPASAIPTKVMLSLRKKVPKDEENSPYNKSLLYGKMAYDLYFKSQKGEDIKFDDVYFQDFIRQALKESYTFPIEVWDALELICVGDFDPIFCAAMGYNYDMLLNEIPKFNGQ
jgi:hypothetical protein